MAMYDEKCESRQRKGARVMAYEITYMDCWHFVSPLIPVNSDYGQDVYCMVFQALKEANERQTAEKRKKRKEEMEND